MLRFHVTKYCAFKDQGISDSIQPGYYVIMYLYYLLVYVSFRSQGHS